MLFTLTRAVYLSTQNSTIFPMTYKDTVHSVDWNMRAGLQTEGHVVASSCVYVGVSSLEVTAWNWLYSPHLSISHRWYLKSYFCDRCFCYRPKVSHSSCVCMCVCVCRFPNEAPCFFFVRPPRALGPPL